MASNSYKYSYIFDPIDSLVCVNCNFVSASVQKLFSHYYDHREEKNFRSPCIFSKNCFHTNEFTSYYGLSTHLRRFHTSFFQGETCTEAEREIVNQTNGEGMEDRNIVNHPNEEATETHPNEDDVPYVVPSTSKSGK